MLSQEVIEQLSEIFVKRAEEVNTFTLRQIAKQLKKIKGFKDLRPTEINKLVNLLKYGGDYNKIKKKLEKMAKVSQKDIDTIFSNTAKKNQEFAKKFYEYRNKPFVPYEKNTALKQQVSAIANITKDTYKNIGNTRAIGLTKKVGKEIIFMGLEEAYTNAIDRGIIALQQGQTTLDQEIRNIVKDYSASGLNYVEFESGYRRRLDSQVRMNLIDGIAQVTQQVNLTFGKEFGADGVEIDAHYNPAPDHAEVQGHQFTNEEFYKFQNDIDSQDVNGKKYPKEHEGHDRRSIGQYNCQHNPYPIIVGVSRPAYTDEELQKIIDDNLLGFDLDGKHYTMYEGTQLQRQLETEIRKAKDLQIMSLEIGDEEMAIKSQKRINALNKKYKQLSDLSGLKRKPNRTRVSGYKRIKTGETSMKKAMSRIDKPKDVQLQSSNTQIKQKNVDEWQEYFGEKYGSYDFLEGVVSYDKSKKPMIELMSDLKQLDSRLLNENFTQLDNLMTKYKFDSGLTLETTNTKKYIALATDRKIQLSKNFFGNYDEMIKTSKRSGELGWHMKVADDKLATYTITHEFGHIVEHKIQDKMSYKGYKDFDTFMKERVYAKALSYGNYKNITELKTSCLSRYGQSKRNFEWFAETFAGMELGVKNDLTKAMEEVIYEYYIK